MTDQRRMRPPCITFFCRGAPFTPPSAPFTPPAAPWLAGGAAAGKPRQGKPRGKPPPTADPSSGAGRLNVHPIRGTPKRSLSAPIARRCAWCRSADANLWSQLPKRTPNCEHRRKRRGSTWEGGNRSHSNHQRGCTIKRPSRGHPEAIQSSSRGHQEAIKSSSRVRQERTFSTESSESMSKVILGKNGSMCTHSSSREPSAGRWFRSTHAYGGSPTLGSRS